MQEFNRWQRTHGQKLLPVVLKTNFPRKTMILNWDDSKNILSKDNFPLFQGVECDCRFLPSFLPSLLLFSLGTVLGTKLMGW